jgi:hypothetical protein
MQFTEKLLLLAGCLASAAASAQLTPLTCPPPAGRACEVFHYHAQMYRPDTKAFTEIFATTQFATQAACERAREQQVAANARIVDYFRNVREQQQYQPDRFGPCHCDLTGERASATYLAEPQRLMQLRNAEEIRLRVRERLLDNKVPSDSELIRGLYLDPPASPAASMPKIAPLPPAAPLTVAVSSDDLQPTRTVDTSKPAVAALDLPLVDLGGAGADAPVVMTSGTERVDPPVLPSSSPNGDATPVIEQETRVEPTPVPEPAPPAETSDDVPESEEEEEEEPAEVTAERFLSYENQRIQNVLRASAAIADETVKTRIFEAAMERIQLLSNLRQLIEGSGVRSRLTTAAREVRTEADRLALAARLFGDGIERHWAPGDAADVVMEVDPAIATAPERVLRDTTGRFTTAQKKRALYLVLGQTQPAEDQRLWLTTVVEDFLK